MKKVNRYNRYLPESVGVEVESDLDLMESLKEKMPLMFPTGNRESSAIYECQTAPMYTNSIIDVAMLGEITRRCIPNYRPGRSDTASTSAHTHIVGFNYELEEAHLEALMVGLMPFLSIGWIENSVLDQPSWDSRA